MTKNVFYFLTDDYCNKFKNKGVMSNKESVDNNLHRRPCYYLTEDPYNDNLYWMIPISSKFDKYFKIFQEKNKKYKNYDGLEFGFVQGRKAVFLIQNICPVLKKDIEEEYLDPNTNKSIHIPNDLKRKINAKANKIISLYYKGINTTLTDIKYIIENND